MISLPRIFFFFFFNDTATTEIYTLSLHDALPISLGLRFVLFTELLRTSDVVTLHVPLDDSTRNLIRSEEHTSELQSRLHLVCRLLLEKKKNNQLYNDIMSTSRRIVSRTRCRAGQH